MSADDLDQLVDTLVFNSRYYLRSTRHRRNRLRSFLRSPAMSTTTTTTPTTTTTTTTTAATQLMRMAHSSQSMIQSKFTGFVPVGVANRDQLMAYDVNRWLCDAETRAQVKSITDDILLIKEAKLAVSSEFGDACRVLNTGRMNQITDYSEFKEKCLKFWRPAAERDRFHALSNFLSVAYDTSLGIFASNLESARMRIIQDLQEDSLFVKGDAASWAAGARAEETLVSLSDIVNYISWGVIFKAAPPSLREALRKVELKFTDDYLDILSSAQSEMIKTEKGVKLELSNFVGRQGRKQDHREQNQRRNGKSQYSVKCFRCEKLGHMARDCVVSLRCRYCKKTGHIASKCFAAKGQSKNNTAGKSDKDVSKGSGSYAEATVGENKSS